MSVLAFVSRSLRCETNSLVIAGNVDQSVLQVLPVPPGCMVADHWAVCGDNR